MRIEAVDAFALERPVERPYVWRRGLPGSGTVSHSTIVRLRTDSGHEGVATARGGAIPLDIVERRLKPMLLGQDPMLKERLWEQVWELDRVEELPIYLFGVVDVALWDLTGKVAGLPLYQLLGGNSDDVPAYASTVTYDDVDQYLRVADECLEAGFRAIKLHAWGDVAEDAELGHRLRKHVGDDVELMYDGSAGFDLQQSVRLGKELEQAGFLWYEEPMREFSISNYQRLCQELTIPVLAAETSDGNHYNVADFIHFGAADLVRTSTGLKGGITGAMRIAHLADAHRMKAEIHGPGLPNLHVACAIPNNSYLEVLVVGEPAHFTVQVDDRGRVAAPQAPGIGREYDWERIERTAYASV